jgi:acetyl esterase/lipase
MHKLHLNQPIMPYNPGIFTHRKKLREIKEKYDCAPNVSPITIYLTLNDNSKLPVQIFRPQNLAPPYPTILFIPGTAFVAAEIAVTTSICTNLAHLAGAQVMVINSRLAPEAQFPIGLMDSLYAIRMILDAKDRCKIDPNRVILTGYSSGGNFAAQIGLLANLPICGQILISPVVDLSRSQQQFQKFEQQDQVISEGFVQWFLKQYIPDMCSPKDPLLSPLFQPITKNHRITPTNIIFGEYDKFRSDSEAFLTKLSDHEVVTMRHMLANEDHSLLWYKKEVVGLMAQIARARFGEQLSSQCQIHFVQPKDRGFLLEAKKEITEQEDYQPSMPGVSLGSAA